MVIKEHPATADSSRKSSAHVFFTDTLSAQMERFVEFNPHQAEGRALGVLFQHDHADGLALLDQVMSNLTHHSRLANTGASSKSDQLTAPRTASKSIKSSPRIRNRLNSFLTIDVLPQVFT